MRVACIGILSVMFGVLGAASPLDYLDNHDPYYPSRALPVFATPQWIGEDGVKAALILSIDDMRDHARYEAYLRPILDALHNRYGSAPLSIMACYVEPGEPHLQRWIAEGVSLETHTLTHPCPLLGTGSFGASRESYEQCVDLLHQVPNSRPVAFRMPCCDSLNTPSPRFYNEIFRNATADGAFLTVDSSVFNITTSNDPALPRALVLEPDGRERFRKYLPFDSFVNTIEDYPYPYLMDGPCLQVPCTVPSDWEAQNIHGVNDPRSVEDMKAAIDATVIKQGVYVLVFHPHGWIENQQVVELIAHADDTYGGAVRFVSFREMLERIERNALAGHSIRDSDGGDNGVRLIDVNGDGFMDVIVANQSVQITRVWDPDTAGWIESPFPAPIRIHGRDTGVRFGWGNEWPGPICLVRNEAMEGAWVFDSGQWRAAPELLGGLDIDGTALFTAHGGVDLGVRFRDIDGDGQSEIVVGNSAQSALFRWNTANRCWLRLPFDLPEGAEFVNVLGQDNGLRLRDLTGDGTLDTVFSNELGYGVYVFDDLDRGWAHRIRRGAADTPGALPPIAFHGENFGAWFHSGYLWYQNETTGSLPDHVHRRSYGWLVRQGGEFSARAR